MKFNHREIIEKTLSGENTDGLPVAFWKHFPVDDQYPETLAKSTLEFQNIFDFDFLKITPSSSFCLKDWGAKDIWQGNVEGTRDYLGPVIKKPQDWLKLKSLNPLDGFLGKQIECIKLVITNSDKHTPIIQTVFNPLSQAKNLAGRNNLFYHMRKYPEHLHHGLSVIKESTARVIEACSTLGVDGVFYAVQHASYDLLTETEFKEFVRKYDEELFPLFDMFWFNVLHIHGSNIMFHLVSDYPAQVFNWHDRETSPYLKNGLEFCNKTVCGGLSRINTMVLGCEDTIRFEIIEALDQTKGKNFIVGTGCVLPLNAPWGNIHNAVNIAHSIGNR